MNPIPGLSPAPRRRLRRCLPLLCALLLPGQATRADDTAQLESASTDLSAFTTWLDEAAGIEAVPGGALAIVSREGVSQLRTWGVRSLDTREPVNAESVFRLASMSKTFAGTAAELLVDQHLQRWDSPLTDLFPGMQLGTGNTTGSITLQQIVSHSTGLMPHAYSNLLDDGVAYDRIKGKFNQIPTVCAPGKCYGYQNVVFSLVGDVVEKTTGESYAHFIEERLFKPLGMASASIGLDSYLNNDNATAPHLKTTGGWHTTTTNPAYYSVAPASGVNASIDDMALWVRANLGAFPEILSPEALAHLQEPVIATPYGGYFNNWSGLEKAYYATGWRVFDYKGMRVIHHGGGVRGYRSEMVFVPTKNVGMVLLMNAETKLANDVVPAFLDNLTDRKL